MEKSNNTKRPTIQPTMAADIGRHGAHPRPTPRQMFARWWVHSNASCLLAVVGARGLGTRLLPYVTYVTYCMFFRAYTIYVVEHYTTYVHIVMNIGINVGVVCIMQVLRWWVVRCEDGWAVFMDLILDCVISVYVFGSRLFLLYFCPYFSIFGYLCIPVPIPAIPFPVKKGGNGNG